jgi:hypothetical protein
MVLITFLKKNFYELNIIIFLYSSAIDSLVSLASEKKPVANTYDDIDLNIGEWCTHGT